MPGMAFSQSKSPYSFRAGAALSFGMSNIANNNVGLGGIIGAERRINKLFSVEAEGSYSYNIGDDVLYPEGKNKSFAIPILAGLKLYPFPNFYGTARVGAIYFLLNQISVPQVSLAYGLAGGFNFPKQSNRLNVQLGYTGFEYESVQRGYATLAVAIIIN
jgi:hypothetical protein